MINADVFRKLNLDYIIYYKINEYNYRRLINMPTLTALILTYNIWFKISALQ